MRANSYSMSIKDIHHLVSSISPYINLYPQSKEYVQTFMKEDMPTVHPGESLKSAIEKMHNRELQAIAIIDEDRQYWGILSLAWCKKEMIAAFKQEQDEIQIKDILLKLDKSPTLLPQSNTKEAIEVFEQFGMSYIPVVDEHNFFIGMISRTDLVGFLFYKHELADMEDEAFL